MMFKNINNNSGYLELIIGPMFAGKSSELIRLTNLYKCLNKKVLAINHKLNTRYGGAESITTHDKTKLNSCVVMDELSKLKVNYKDKFSDCDIIIIEELQFFNDAYSNITDWIYNDKKIVICASLDGDFMKDPFGDVLRLIPHADKVQKFTAFCKECNDGTPGIFTKRIIKNNNRTLIGSDEYYAPVCRKHYNN